MVKIEKAVKQRYGWRKNKRWVGLGGGTAEVVVETATQGREEQTSFEKKFVKVIWGALSAWLPLSPRKLHFFSFSL